MNILISRRDKNRGFLCERYTNTPRDDPCPKKSNVTVEQRNTSEKLVRTQHSRVQFLSPLPDDDWWPRTLSPSD